MAAGAHNLKKLIKNKVKKTSIFNSFSCKHLWKNIVEVLFKPEYQAWKIIWIITILWGTLETGSIAISKCKSVLAGFSANLRKY